LVSRTSKALGSSENNAQGVKMTLSIVVIKAFEAQSSGARSLTEMTQGGSQEMTQGGSQSSGAHSLAGMMKTWTWALHVTHREACRRTSTCGLQLTVREGFCRGLPSGPEGRTELRRKRDEPLDTVLELLALLALLALQGFGGILRNHDTESMLWGSVGKL
jgi:hypothetical protein